MPATYQQHHSNEYIGMNGWYDSITIWGRFVRVGPYKTKRECNRVAAYIRRTIREETRRSNDQRWALGDYGWVYRPDGTPVQPATLDQAVQYAILAAEQDGGCVDLDCDACSHGYVAWDDPEA